MVFYDESQLETKKQYVLYVVEVICRSRNLPMPSFDFYGCPEEEEDQLAHYHPDSNTICIIFERDKEKEDKTNETIESVSVKIGNVEIRFRILLHINTLSFDPVTKHSNLGIDMEYIIKNEYLSMFVVLG